MAHITQFTVTGLAGRSSVTQELDRHVNVFFGVNGSGKTSLLKILDSAMAGDTSRLRNVPFLTASVSIHSEDYKQTFTRTLSKSALPQGRQSATEVTWAWVGERLTELRTPAGVAWEIDPPLPKSAPGHWIHIYLPITRMYALPTGAAASSYRYEAANMTFEEQLDANFSSMLQALWTAYYTEVLTQVRQAQEEGLASILQAVLSAQERDPQGELDPDLAFKRVSSFLQRQGSPKAIPTRSAFVSRYRKDARIRSVVSDIDEVETRIGAVTAPRSKLQDLIERLFVGKKIHLGDSQITIQSDEQGPLELGVLSSGEKQVLRILVETLRVGISSLLIDEPELSMHIDWQQELVASMRQLNPRAQLIMATHSPEIMGDIDDDKIFRL